MAWCRQATSHYLSQCRSRCVDIWHHQSQWTKMPLSEPVVVNLSTHICVTHNKSVTHNVVLITSLRINKTVLKSQSFSTSRYIVFAIRPKWNMKRFQDPHKFPDFFLSCEREHLTLFYSTTRTLNTFFIRICSDVVFVAYIAIHIGPNEFDFSLNNY